MTHPQPTDKPSTWWVCVHKPYCDQWTMHSNLSPAAAQHAGRTAARTNRPHRVTLHHDHGAPAIKTWNLK